MFAFKNFRIRFIFSYIAVILLSFAGLGLFLSDHLAEIFHQQISSSLINQAYLIGRQINPAYIRQADFPALDNLVKDLGPQINARVTVMSHNGRVLADSNRSLEEIFKMENHAHRPEVNIALKGGRGVNPHFSSALKIDMLYVAVPLREKTEIVGAVQLAYPLTQVMTESSSLIHKTLFGGLLLALGSAFFLGSWLIAQVDRLMQRLVKIKRRYSREGFSEKIIRHSSDEISELSLGLDKMEEDIESQIREIQTQKQNFTAIFDSMVEGVIVVDKSGQVISINPTVEKIFSLLKKEAEGKPFLEVIRNNQMADVINRVLVGGTSLSGEMALVIPVRRVFQFNAVPVFECQAVRGCLVVIHDITHIRKLETVHRDFVANVSHELKTPLTSIKGFVETLLAGALDDKKNNRNFLKIIETHTERLNVLVDDLLSLAHLQSDEIALDKKVYDLTAQVGRVLGVFESQIAKGNIKISNELPSHLFIRADQARIEQVLINLIDNALKFNKQNGAIKFLHREMDKGLKMIIQDTGIGIPEQDIPRIFERFYRVDRARSRELGGTGLGLSIVKSIVDLHQGSVGVESREGEGSSFWFYLPH